MTDQCSGIVPRAVKGQAEVHGVIIRKHLLISDKFEDLINPFDYPAPVPV